MQLMSGTASSALQRPTQLVVVVVHVQAVQGHGHGQAQAPLMQQSDSPQQSTAQAKPTSIRRLERRES